MDWASPLVGAWGWSRPRRVSLNPTVDLATTSHLSDLQSPTMIRFPNSPFGCKGRQGAQSICRWTEVHHGNPRATLHVSRWYGAELLHAASSTTAPPTSVRWPPSPPHCPVSGGAAANWARMHPIRGLGNKKLHRQCGGCMCVIWTKVEIENSGLGQRHHKTIYW